MIRYHLDDLGWYQFEELSQSLLKARCGLGVESWGGRGDFGIDAYAQIALKFPGESLSNGPFLFQVKFVENANAAGANPNKVLENAIRKEIVSIKERKKKKRWKDPKFYTLITNAPLSTSIRDNLFDLLHDELPTTSIIQWGGNDICDLLDQFPNIRRSFPQILSLRDLDTFLRDAVDKALLQRSQSAVDLARDIVPVFVPTIAYEKCWKTLNKHNFAVLEGPPEVGKTAIAWMVALPQLSHGWEVIVCDKLDDFFARFSYDTDQVFVADDAFGRTEYDPERGIQWEKQLDRVVHKLDLKHWLIWTSRKHILERARQVMDLQGKTSNFPHPADVIVDADSLQIKEKALMLYRHAKSMKPEDEARSFVKRYAKFIVNHRHFTPERIRRFVQEELFELSKEMQTKELNNKIVQERIDTAIQTPTERMKKSFRSLDMSHKLFLLALLESADISKNYRSLKQRYLKQTRNLDKPLSFEAALEQLSEAFVKVYDYSI